MVEVGGSRLLQLSCGSREFGQSPQVSAAGDSPLDACASASQSKAPDHLASPRRFCGSLASPTCHPSSLSQPALRRHTSEVRAACSNPARADPCGGRQATGVPTATPGNGVNPLDGTNYLGTLGSPKIQDTRVVQATWAPSLASDGHTSEY